MKSFTTLAWQQQAENVDKLDYQNWKKICVSKDTIKRVKRQPMEWEKILTNHMYNRKLISRICKELIKLSNNEKIVKDWNRHFSKECILMANKHTKRCSISLTTREIQIKTTMRYCSIANRMIIIKKYLVTCDGTQWRIMWEKECVCACVCIYICVCVCIYIYMAGSLCYTAEIVRTM